MELTLLAKDAESGKTGCESVYRPTTDGERAIVQGTVLDEETEQNLVNVLPGESAVSIKIEVLREALRAIDG